MRVRRLVLRNSKGVASSRRFLRLTESAATPSGTSCGMFKLADGPSSGPSGGMHPGATDKIVLVKFVGEGSAYLLTPPSLGFR